MRFIYALLMLFCCTIARADDSDERTQLALRLVDLTEVKETNRDAKQCHKVFVDDSKEIIAQYHRDPDNFHGISPQSAYWPEVEAVYRDVYAVTCASSALGGVESLHAKAYATMSVSSLRTAVAFYASPAAQEMKIAGKRGGDEVRAMTKQALHSADMAGALAKYREAMDRLADKYKADPR